MKKIIFSLAIGILLLTLLCLGSYGVVLATRGHSLLGLGKPIRAFATFPDLVREVLSSQEVRSIPLSHIPADDGYDPATQDINRLTDDLYGLMAFYRQEDKMWEVVLENYRDGSVVKSWKLPREIYVANTDRSYATSRPKHSILLPDDHLLVNFTRSQNLVRIDRNGQLEWANRDMLYHHSMNLDAEGHVWTCGTPYLDDQNDPFLNYTYENADGRRYRFRDDHLVRIDVNTGETISDISISEILIANDQFGRLVGNGQSADPIHLNDVQPALADGPYWQRGDLFLSTRNISAVLHYRPSTNEIIKIIEGPLIAQHDAAILSDHEISVFNNNYSSSGKRANEQSADHRLLSSEIAVYNYETDSTYAIHSGVMNEHHLHTPTAGLHFKLSDGKMLVDLDDFGRIVVLDSTGIVFSKTYPSSIEGYKHLTSWPRIYERLPE